MENQPIAGTEQVDVLLDGGTVVTMDAARRVIEPGAVAVRGNAIVAVGPSAEVLSRYSAAYVVDCRGHVVMPGLINAHGHLPMSLLRGLADDLRLDVWLHGYILPVEREFVNPEFCFLGATLACAEMLRGGTTCFADMYYFEEEIAWAAAEAGMRGVCGETVMKLPTPDAADYEEGLRHVADFLGRWQGHELIVAAPAPHSAYMCTPEILRQTAALAREYDVPQLIHLSETVEEVESWLDLTNMRPVRWLEDAGVLASKVTAAHCVHVTSEEMHLLTKWNVGVAHCPTSNLKLASGIAPVAEMLATGVAVGVGTDGCASNNNLDMFEELRLAGLLPKGISRNPVVVPAAEALAMATIYGARALHLDHLIGSLEPGKRADITVVDMERLHNLPHYDTTGQNVYSRLVYAAQAADVRHVFVNGKHVMDDGDLLVINERDVIEQTRRLSQRINRFFLAHEKSVLDKLVSIGGLQQQETFEVQGKGRVHDLSVFEQALANPALRVTRHTSRDQYDTYFLFADPAQGRLRYREDNVSGADGRVHPIYSLTLTGPTKEAVYENSVVLSRSRFTAPADRSLRFYREFFQPSREIEIVKHRERYHIRYQGLDFAVNLDRFAGPEHGTLYMEIKSRTWSQQDAVRKADLIGELLAVFGVQPGEVIGDEYMELREEDED